MEVQLLGTLLEELISEAGSSLSSPWRHHYWSLFGGWFIIVKSMGDLSAALTTAPACQGLDGVM